MVDITEDFKKLCEQPYCVTFHPADNASNDTDGLAKAMQLNTDKDLNLSACFLILDKDGKNQASYILNVVKMQTTDCIS